MHLRIHPIFADSFLPSLDQLPSGSPLNDFKMHTELEIILSPTEGGIVTMGISRTSGVTAFDINALEAVSKAAPFGKAPDEIVSGDGNVYLHWEFYRNPDFACSTYFAKPYILKGDTAPVPTQAPPPTRSPERPLRGGYVPTGFSVPVNRATPLTNNSARYD
jgi:hypothetical protein